MSTQTVESRLRDILSMECGIDTEEITSNASLEDDLGLDSLDKTEFLMAIEDEFELKISDDDFDGLKTFQQVVAYVGKRTEH